jgi:GT2 family glycosyltransferase
MPGQEQLDASVIVPVRDEATRLQQCLRALAAQDYPADRFEVVVVDSASEPPLTLTGPPGLALRTVRVDQPGSYLARNAGIETARGRVLAFTDADCLPDRGWLRAAVEALDDRDAIVTGPIEVFARDPRRLHPAEAWELVHAFPQQRYAADGWCATANMVTTAGVFAKVGRFDPELLSGGDVAWGLGATDAGVPILFDERARVRHPARASFRELGAKLARVHRGARERRRAAGVPEGPWWREPTRGWVPPLGSVARGWRDPRFPTLRARLALAVGEFFVRYRSLAVRTQQARDLRPGDPS